MPIASDGLPDILKFPNSKFSSISMYRAIKQTINVIENLLPVGEINDAQQATLDDLNAMLLAVGRPMNLIEL